MGWTRLFHRGLRDRDTAREIASYIAIETDDNIARGMSPQAAHDAAVRKFGSALRVREVIDQVVSRTRVSVPHESVPHESVPQEVTV